MIKIFLRLVPSGFDPKINFSCSSSDPRIIQSIKESVSYRLESPVGTGDVLGPLRGGGVVMVVDGAVGGDGLIG